MEVSFLLSQLGADLHTLIKLESQMCLVSLSLHRKKYCSLVSVLSSSLHIDRRHSNNGYDNRLGNKELIHFSLPCLDPGPASEGLDCIGLGLEA